TRRGTRRRARRRQRRTARLRSHESYFQSIASLAGRPLFGWDRSFQADAYDLCRFLPGIRKQRDFAFAAGAREIGLCAGRESDEVQSSVGVLMHFEAVPALISKKRNFFGGRIRITVQAVR